MSELSTVIDHLKEVKKHSPHVVIATGRQNREWTPMHANETLFSTI